MSTEFGVTTSGYYSSAIKKQKYLNIAQNRSTAISITKMLSGDKVRELVSK